MGDAALLEGLGQIFSGPIDLMGLQCVVVPGDGRVGCEQAEVPGEEVERESAGFGEGSGTVDAWVPVPMDRRNGFRVGVLLCGAGGQKHAHQWLSFGLGADP